MRRFAVITLVNEGSRARIMELTSAAELSLAPHGADRAHPAFSKLFVQTEARTDLHALLAWRRLRSPDESPIWVAQLLIGSRMAKSPFEYETDRAGFLGEDAPGAIPRCR
jgi:cyclic beta-1,2-glucan synthetase